MKFPQRCRRLFRFRLRTLLIYLTLAACAMGWFSNNWQGAKRQRVAVEYFQRGGFRAVYDYQITEDGTDYNAVPPIPRWLLNLCGRDVFCDVVKIAHTKSSYHTMANLRVADDGLVHLQGLPRLRSLDLRFTSVTDAGLKRVHGLTNLDRVYVECTSVTDQGVAKLQAALPNCVTSGPTMGDEPCEERFPWGIY